MNSHQAIRGFLTFILLAGIFSTAYIGFNVSEGTNFLSIASNDKNKPNNIKITDISKSSAIITWETGGASLGKIIYGVDATVCKGLADNKLCFEAKETAIAKSTHRILLTNLKESTTYYIYLKIGEDILYPASVPLNFRTF